MPSSSRSRSEIVPYKSGHPKSKSSNNSWALTEKRSSQLKIKEKSGSSSHSSKREADVQLDVLKENIDDKHCAVIIVTSGSRRLEVEKKCREIEKVRNGKARAMFFIGSDNYLQPYIEQVHRDPARRQLIIVVSRDIPELMFDIHSEIKDLQIVRGTNRPDENDQLIINGISRYHGLQVDTWEGRDKDQYRQKLCLGDRISIKPDFLRNPSWGIGLKTVADSFSREQRDQVSRHVNHMNGISMDDTTWWKSWEFTIAGILGMAASGAKFLAAFKARAGGIYVQYQFGLTTLTVGAGGGTVSSVITAAGPATLIGVGVAASIYFIPWDSMFSVFESVFSWAWEGIKLLWGKFKEWLASAFSKRVFENPGHAMQIAF